MAIKIPRGLRKLEIVKKSFINDKKVNLSSFLKKLWPN